VVEVGQVGHRCGQGCTDFPKMSEPLRNYRCQKDDVKQVPYWVPTSIRHHPTKFSHMGDPWHPGFVHPWIWLCHYKQF